ncbi:hypothetical protein [Tropicibacter sp. S64]|uniref:hypothetical protein n=1 Tax=Tropicibacter sp. S64 TaxID=3415122 RepID=UPI003C7A186C
MRFRSILAVAALGAAPALADTILATNNGIVRDSLCVGGGCTNPESYDAGEGVFRLKDVYPRIEFIDTSNSTGSYPYYNWRLRANEDYINGPNLFAIENLSTGARPFTIRGGAGSNSIFVNDDGDIGLGTLLPQTKLHLVDTASPTIRFQQTSAGGLPAQTWDLLANHGNVFLRDINTDTTPFSVFKNAPTNSLRITHEGNIGNGTSGVDASLHILRDNGTASIKIEETSATTAAREMIEMRNNGGSYFTMTNTDTGRSWYFVHENNAQGRFFINHSDGGLQLSLTRMGDLAVPGTITAGGTQLNVPDYVFGEDYALRPLSEVKAFIDANSHLPEVPSAAQIRAEGLDMTTMQLTLLKKVEELTLYTLEQETQIADQTAVIHDQTATIASLSEQLARIEARLAAVETR